MSCAQNTTTGNVLKDKLEKLVRECKTEAELRKRCKNEFEGFSDIRISFLPTVRIANLCITGRPEPIHAVVENTGL